MENQGNAMETNGWKADWLGILGLIIGVIGLASSYYFYKLSIKEREPILLEESFRPMLVAADSLKNSPLKVVNADGSVIKKDLSSLRYYFWNSGGESIRHANILQPIRLELASEDIQIIDVKLLTTSRPEIVNPVVGLSKNSSRSVEMSFNILEKNDGFSIEILYAGTHATPLILHGTIEGVEKISTGRDLASYQYYKSLIWKLGLSLVSLLAVTMPILFPPAFFQRLNFKRKLMVIGVLYVVSFVLAGVFIHYDKRANEKIELTARQSMLDIVPLSIKSELDVATRTVGAE